MKTLASAFLALLCVGTFFVSANSTEGNPLILNCGDCKGGK